MTFHRIAALVEATAEATAQPGGVVDGLRAHGLGLDIGETSSEQ